jgi:hypothetical protein
VRTVLSRGDPEELALVARIAPPCGRYVSNVVPLYVPALGRDPRTRAKVPRCGHNTTTGLAEPVRDGRRWLSVPAAPRQPNPPRTERRLAGRAPPEAGGRGRRGAGRSLLARAPVEKLDGPPHQGRCRPESVKRNLILSRFFATLAHWNFDPSLAAQPVPPPCSPFTVKAVNAPASWSDEYSTATVGEPLVTSSYLPLTRLAVPKPRGMSFVVQVNAMLLPSASVAPWPSSVAVRSVTAGPETPRASGSGSMRRSALRVPVPGRVARPACPRVDDPAARGLRRPVKTADERVDPGRAVEDREDVVAAMHARRPRLVPGSHVGAVQRPDALAIGRVEPSARTGRRHRRAGTTSPWSHAARPDPPRG